jgi:UDP-glucose 4-epimerase
VAAEANSRYSLLVYCYKRKLMKILIIGVSGFIGSNCYKYFSSKGHDVTAADVVQPQNVDNFILLEKEHTDFASLFNGRSYDFCINASGAASVPLSTKYPQLDFELNTYNVLKMLEAIRINNPTCVYINFSSAAVYGNPLALPISEDVPLAPLSPYGHHKLMAEQILKEYREFFGIKSFSLRVFSAYGPGLQKQFFWDLHQKMQKGGEVKLYGTGKESRDFIFIDDITKAVETVMINADHLPTVINIASGNETTIEEATSVFKECAECTAETSFGGELRKGDPLNWRADVSVLRSVGFSASHSLRDGLNSYVLWLREEKG